MSEPITRQDLDQLGDRIERRFDERFNALDERFNGIDRRFDRFEAHFDDTMTAVRASLDEIHDQVAGEQRRTVAKLEGAIIELARQTGHLDNVAVLLRP